MKLTHISRRICSAVCVLAIGLSCIPAAHAVEKISYKKSGDLAAAKMTQTEIAALLDDAPITSTPTDETFVQTPSVTAPYAPGEVSEKVLQDTTNRLNALRALAGLPAVTLDAGLCEEAQYGAVLLAASEFSHEPAKPSDMDEDFYRKGLAATSTSNIFAGLTLIYTPDGFMDDSDTYNIAKLGHRRWQLNPTLGKIGFGYAYKSGTAYRHYSAEKVFDRSGAGCDYDFIAWPASGNFASEDGGTILFDTTTAWSITLNPSKYSTRNLASQDITVTLVRESDGKTWTFNKSQADGFFNIDTGNYGVSNCIVFRPNDVGTVYDGIYTVQVSGLSDAAGNPVSDFVYQVDFFDASTVAPACRHTQITNYPAVASTCTTQGHAAYTKCDLCGEILSGTDALLPLADHQYGTLVAEKPASCEASGLAAHYQCAVCKAYFDADKNATTYDALILSTLGHSWSGWQSDANNHWKSCGICGEIAEKAAHSWSWVVDQPATEEATGLKHEECTVCGAKRNENTVIDKLDHVHVGVKRHAAVPATCHTEGTVEYWTCSSPLCAGKYYADEACSVSLTTIVAPVDPNNHDGGTKQEGAVAPTCTLDGKENDTYCLGCGAKIADGKILPALGHDFSIQKQDETGHWKVCSRCSEAEAKQPHSGGTASCSARAVCVVCGAAYGALDADCHLHTELRDTVEPTESSEGYTGDTWCTDCNTLVKKGETLPKLAHQLTFHPEKAATCAQEGNVAYWTCSNPECNGKYYADKDGSVELESIVLPRDPENHTGKQGLLGAKEATCTEAGYSGDVYCTACNTVLEKGHKIAALGHEYQNGVCTRCGQKDPNSSGSGSGQTPSTGGGQGGSTSGQNNTQTATPQTGEGNTIFYLGALLVVSVSALGGVMVFRRKKEAEEQR